MSIERIMSNHGCTEEIANRSLSEYVEGEVQEFQTLTQEAVNEQIRGFIAPLTRQLDEFTRLVQGMTTSRLPNSYPRTYLGTTSGTAMPQFVNDHGMNHGRHGNHTMIMPWIMTSMLKNMAVMPFSSHDHDRDSPWPRHDHGKIMPCQPCFSNPGI